MRCINQDMKTWTVAITLLLTGLYLWGSMASAAGAGSISDKNRWEYQEFWIKEPDLGVSCLPPDKTICYQSVVGRQLTDLANRGWEILSVDRQQEYSTSERRYYYILARKPK